MPALVVLTLVFCLGSGPGSCTAETGPRRFVSGAACAAAAQPLAAQWLGAHDDAPWRLLGWTCGPGDGDDI
jgi:hypothetical protein